MIFSFFLCSFLLLNHLFIFKQIVAYFLIYIFIIEAWVVCDLSGYILLVSYNSCSLVRCDAIPGFFFFLLLNLTSFFVVLFLLLAIYSCLSWSLDCLYFQFALAGNQCLHCGFALPCMLVHSFYFLALVVPLFHLVCPISSLDFNLAVHLFGAVIR